MREKEKEKMDEFIRDTIAMAKIFPNIETEGKIIFNKMTRIPVEHHDLTYAVVLYTLLVKANLKPDWD